MASNFAILLVVVFLAGRAAADLLPLPEPTVLLYEQDAREDDTLLLCWLLGGVIASFAATQRWRDVREKLRSLMPGATISVFGHGRDAGVVRGLGDDDEERAYRERFVAKPQVLGASLPDIDENAQHRGQLAYCDRDVEATRAELRRVEGSLSRWVPWRRNQHRKRRFMAAAQLRAATRRRDAVAADPLKDVARLKARVRDEDGVEHEICLARVAASEPAPAVQSPLHRWLERDKPGMLRVSDFLLMVERRTGLPRESLRLVTATSTALERARPLLNGDIDFGMAERAALETLDNLISTAALETPPVLDELETLDNFGYTAVARGNFSELHARAQALEIQATLDGREYRPIGVLLYAIPRHERAVGFM